MGVIVRSTDFIAAASGPGFIQRVSMPTSFDVTPTCFRLLVFGTTADGTIAQSVRFSEGWFDGTNSWCRAGRSQYTIGSTDCDNYATEDATTDRVGAVITTNAQTLDDFVEWDSWGVDASKGYVDFHWNDGVAPSSAWRCRLTCWAGDDLTVEVGSFSTVGITVDVEETVTVATGLVPQAVRLLSSTAASTTGDNYGTGMRFGGGWGVSDGAASPSIQQFAHGWMYQSATTNPWAGGTMESSEEAGGTARIYAQGDSTVTGSGLMTLELTDSDSGSFKYTPRENQQSFDICYVVFDVESAIDLGISYYEQVGSADGGYDSTPDITYTSVMSGAATFKPQHVDWSASDMPDTGYNRGNLTASMNPYGVADTDNPTGSMFSFICKSRDNDGECWTYYDSGEFIHVFQEDASTLRWSADVDAFIASGIRLAIGTIPSTTTKVSSSIAWGGPAGGSGWRANHIRRQTNQLRRM